MSLEIVKRIEWGAIEPTSVETLELPVEFVVLKKDSRLWLTKDPVWNRQNLRTLTKRSIKVDEKTDLEYNAMSLAMVSRLEWGAIDPEGGEKLNPPVSYVVLKYNSRVQPCKEPAQCRHYLRNLQKYTMRVQERWDVDYNFYVGGDGKVYEGRGWTRLPFNDDEFYGKALSFCYMGMFNKDQNPPEIMVNTMQELIKFGVQKKYITKSHKVIDRVVDEPA